MLLKRRFYSVFTPHFQGLHNDSTPSLKIQHFFKRGQYFEIYALLRAKNGDAIDVSSKGQFYLPPKKQKPQIDFLRLLCYNRSMEIV